MPLHWMHAAATSAATQTAGDDLRYTREEHGLSEHAQVVLATLGCDKIRRMARIAEIEAGLRATIQAQLALGGRTSVAGRILVADICSCWSEVQQQVARGAELRAEARTHGHQEPSQLCEHRSTMAVALQVHGQLDNQHAPRRYFGRHKSRKIVCQRAADRTARAYGRKNAKENSSATTSTTTTGQYAFPERTL